MTSCILDASTLGRMGVEDGYASVTILFSKPPVVFLRCPKFHPLRVSKRVRVCLPLARSLARCVDGKSSASHVSLACCVDGMQSASRVPILVPFGYSSFTHFSLCFFLASSLIRFDVDACTEWQFDWVFQRVWVSFLFMGAYFGFWEVTLYMANWSERKFR